MTRKDKPPKKLYKYMAISNQRLININQGQVYFDNPSNFNDPYDCQIPALIKKLNKEKIEKLKEKLINDFSVEQSEGRDRLVEEIRNASGETLEEICKASLDKLIDRGFHSRGITCFSEDNSSVLMWSHYADKGRGICVEYDTELSPELFEKIRKVKYSQNLPSINVFQALYHDDFNSVTDLFFVKAKDWEYEKEWRCLHREQEKIYFHKPNSITGIYFGTETTDENKTLVYKMVKDGNSDINFYKAERSRERFKLIFSKIEPTNSRV